MALEGKLLMPMWMGMGINSVVHGLMYYYYYLRQCGYKVWWRKLVTQIQTSQFVLGAVMTAYGAFHFFKNPSLEWHSTGLPMFTYDRGCDSSAWAIYICGCFNLAFLLLFTQWYFSTYMQGMHQSQKKRSGMPADAAGNDLSSHEKTC